MSAQKKTNAQKNPPKTSLKHKREDSEVPSDWQAKINTNEFLSQWNSQIPSAIDQKAASDLEVRQ